MINKKELTEMFADYTDQTLAESGRQIEWLFETIMDSAKNEGGCVLPGLGKLTVVETAARSGVARGVAWEKPAGRKFKLSLSKAAKEEV